MLPTPSTLSDSASDNETLWDSLKQAIANSSGFNGWQSQLSSAEQDTTPLDQLVRRYLRETLETLAY
jgi:hypothetical protein